MDNIKGKFKTDVVSEKKDIKDIWRRIIHRDFSGNVGIAIKNSIYQTSTTIVAKLGSLIFTIIIARLLLPELFGLYNLALSTILFFSAFANLGIGETIITFVSRVLGKNKKKTAKAYTVYFGKIKFLLVFLAVLVLLVSAKFISETYYQKPLFLALIAGCLYLLSFEIVTFFVFILQASNTFKSIFQKEIIFQVSRIILVPIIVLVSLKYSISNENLLFYMILMLAFSYLFAALFMMFISKRSTNFLKSGKENLSVKQKKEANKFLRITAVFILSGMFFSYIDKIILGRFVAAEFIGYYAAAMNLVGALSSLVGFGVVLLPIFSRLKGKELEKGLKKSLKIVFTIGFLLFLITLILSPLVISVIYGSEYTPSTDLLRVFSLLLIPLPLIGIYSVYFLSRNKPQIVAKILVIATILDTLLSYILIVSLLKYGEMASVLGAGVATIISQTIYLFGLVFYKRRTNATSN